MASHSAHIPSALAVAPSAKSVANIAALAVPVGRAFFAAMFLIAGPTHLSPQMAAYAAQQGVPLAHIAVPFSGLLAFLGGLSVLLGYRARLGALLIVAFLVPVTLTMHNFWAIDDPMTAMIQQGMFMKNLAMLGGALLITHFGAGPYSLDARRT